MRSRRGAVGLTSLIDVIFLLLLFFMLTTSFSRQTDVSLVTASAGTGAPGAVPPLFLRLTKDGLSLNGQSLPLVRLPAKLASQNHGADVLLSVTPDVSAQGLADVLGAVRGLPHRIRILG